MGSPFIFSVFLFLIPQRGFLRGCGVLTLEDWIYPLKASSDDALLGSKGPGPTLLRLWLKEQNFVDPGALRLGNPFLKIYSRAQQGDKKGYGGAIAKYYLTPASLRA